MALPEFLAHLLDQQPQFIGLLNTLLRSVVVVAAFLLVDELAGRRMPSAARHILWLCAFGCLALLPVLPAVGALLSYQPASSLTFVLNVTAAPATLIQSSWGQWLLYGYLLPCVVLGARLGLALYRTLRLGRQAVSCVEPQLLVQLAQCRVRSGVNRSVSLGFSDSIQSPVSFGLLHPQIVLPVPAQLWSREVLGDVLLHELGHIRRMDWLSMLFARVVAIVFWVNPLVRLAMRRFNDEAENSCDAAVILAGRRETDYACSLLSVAKACAGNGRIERVLPVQSMLDRSTFKLRITRLLEDKMMNPILTKKEIRKAAVLFTVVSAALLTGLASTQIVSAQAPNPADRTVDQEMLPLVNVTPMYPTVAAAEGIEGWVQVKFTVTDTGTVDRSSIEIVDADPVGIFDNNSIAATAQFQFRPRIRSGQPVAVPGVQYVFRYELENDSGQAQEQGQ